MTALKRAKSRSERARQFDTLPGPDIAIDDFCETGTGGTPLRANAGRYYGGTIPWVKSGELKDDILMSTEEHITEHAIRESNARLVPAGTLLIALYGATVGKTALLGIEAATNQAVCYIIPDPNKAVTRYVWYALRSKINQLLAQRVGGAQPNISQGIIRKTKIFLPPPPEQRRIVEILDQADALRKLRREADAISERILPALFYKMFGDPVRNEKGWEVTELGEVVVCLDNMRIPVNEDDRMSRVGNIPYFGANGQVGVIDDAIFSEKLVLLSEDGGYWGPNQRSAYIIDGPAWVNNHAHVLRCASGIREEYLTTFLNVIDLRTYTTGTTRGKLNQESMKKIRILIPPIDMQSAFANSHQALTDHKSYSGQANEGLSNLFISLLHRAFTGELTAKWREENPALFVRQEGDL